MAWPGGVLTRTAPNGAGFFELGSGSSPGLCEINLFDPKHPEYNIFSYKNPYNSM